MLSIPLSNEDDRGVNCPANLKNNKGENLKTIRRPVAKNVGRDLFGLTRERRRNGVYSLKGQCHDNQWFFALFLREQKMAVARASVADIRPESLAVRAAWQPGHLRWLLTWQCSEPTREVELELHCFTCRWRQAALLFSGYEARARWYPLLQRFKISSDSYIDIDSLLSCLVLRAFRSLLRRSRRREHGWLRLGEGIGSVVVALFAVTLTRCVTVKANALNEERVRGTDVDVRVDTGFVVAFAQNVTKTWRLKKRTCGKLWGRPGRRPRTFEGDAQGPCMSSVQLVSARRCTFEHCTSCCPCRDATMVVLTQKKKKKKKKKKTPNAAYHSTKKIFWGSVPTSEARCSLKSAVWRRIVSPPVNKRQNNHLASQLQAQLEKVASNSLATIGARSSFSGARFAHEFPRSFLVAAIIFPHTKWLKKITDYRDTPALKWRLTDRYLRWGTLAGPRPGRADADQWLSAGTAHLGFPALLSVPHLLSREIKMNRRHWARQRTPANNCNRPFA